MITKEQVALDRAADDLRRGMPIVLTDHEGKCRLVAASEACKLFLFGNIDRYLVMHRKRANFILKTGLENNVRILIDKKTDIESIVSLASCNINRCGWDHVYGDSLDDYVLDLIKYAHLLPCALVSNIDDNHVKYLRQNWGIDPIILTVNAMLKSLYDDSVVEVCSSPITLTSNKDATIFVYRSKGRDHLAILVGKNKENPLVRIHSSCYTGDILRVLTCDCGEQLRTTIDLMSESGGGVILYLNQEGRNIGLVNKFRAYQMQSSHNMDTITANEILGFDVDERDFSLAANILEMLSIKEMRLITNNPSKIFAMKQKA